MGEKISKEEGSWLDGRLTPLSELSEGTRRSLLAGLEEDWRKMPKEFKIQYLKRGGLEFCEAAGIEVPESLLLAAGLLPNEKAGD